LQKSTSLVLSVSDSKDGNFSAIVVVIIDRLLVGIEFSIFLFVVGDNFSLDRLMVSDINVIVFL